MYVLLVDSVVLGETRTESCSVKDGTGTDDAAFGKTRVLAENVGEDIYWVGDDYVLCIGCVLGDLRDYALNDVDIGLCEIKTGLTRTACDTRGDDYNVGAFGIAIGTGIDGAGTAEGSTLADIECLTESLFVVDIDHDDLGDETCDCQGVGDGGTDTAGSDYRNFVHKRSSFLDVEF